MPVWSGVLFLAHGESPCCVLTWQRELEISLSLVLRPWSCCIRASPLGPHLTPVTPSKALFPETVTLRVRASLYEFEENAIQSIAMTNPRLPRQLSWPWLRISGSVWIKDKLGHVSKDLRKQVKNASEHGKMGMQGKMTGRMQEC